MTLYYQPFLMGGGVIVGRYDFAKWQPKAAGAVVQKLSPNGEESNMDDWAF